MHLYEVTTTTGITLSIFGESFSDAATMFAAWHLAHREEPMPDFEVKQRNPRWPGLNTEQVAATLMRRVSGVGYHDPNVGWVILSPLDRWEG